MDNQQGKNGDIELAWLGGFFDGEGSIGIQHRAGNEMREKHWSAMWMPRVRISNTDYPTLDYIVGILKRNSIAFWIHHRKPKIEYYKPSWNLEILGVKRLAKFGRFILGYLHTKKNDMELLTEFCESRSEKWKQGYSERELEIIEHFRQYRRGPHRLHALQMPIPNGI